MIEYAIRNTVIEDLDEISRVHVSSFFDRALSQLGLGAVKRYYRWLLTSFPDSHPICAETPEGKVIGFCFPGVYSGSFSGFLKNNSWFLFSTILLRPWLLFNPIVRERISLSVRTLKKLFKKRQQSKSHQGSASVSTLLNQSPKPRLWGILSIAVDPAFQRQGVAEAMMRFIETLLKYEGINKLHLTVHTDNTHAVRFYEKLGWEKVPVGDTWQGSMIKWLDQDRVLS